MFPICEPGKCRTFSSVHYLHDVFLTSREEIRARDLFHLDSIPQVPQCFAITMSIYYCPVAKEVKKENALCVPNTASTLPTDYWNVAYPLFSQDIVHNDFNFCMNH